MLVLGRKVSEVIRIGDDISIMVIDIRGDKVRLGIDCPKNIPVHREEVYDAIQREKSDAKGLAGANAEQEMYLNAHKSYQAPEDDQPLQQKMEDERGNR